MQSKGEDAPSENDIDEFGLYYACQRTHGNFSIFKDGEYAARGRIGTSPLYWNRQLGLFSFLPGRDLVEFPAGHLYKFCYDHLVCWDPVYFDNPCPTSPKAYSDVKSLLMNSVNKHQADAFIMSSGCGSRLVDKFLNPLITSYTIGTLDSFDVKHVTRPNSVIIEYTSAPMFLSPNEKPMYALAKYMAENTTHKKLICGLGCTELFRDSYNFRPNVNHIVDQFAKFGIQIWSPFFDSVLMEYVLDLTLPEDRPYILSDLLEDEEDYRDGSEIYETTGTPRKKSWYTTVNEIIQRWIIFNE